MIRPLNSPSDLWLVRSLKEKGKGFGLVPDNSGVWQRVFLSLIFFPLAEENLATYVLLGEEKGFVQTRKSYGREGVEVIYLAPAPCYAPVGEPLLNYACWRLGTFGVKKLFVDVPEGEDGFFRHAGFSVYAREFLYLIDSLPEGLPEPGNWQPLSRGDRLAQAKAYQSLTPTPVRQIEGGLGTKKLGFPHTLMVEQKEMVLKEGGTPIAFLSAWKEGGSSWVRLLLQPGLEAQSTRIVGMALAWAKANFPPPFAFRVRSYEGALAKGLEEWGFPPQKSLSIMVRNILAMEKVILKQIPAIS